MPQVEVKLSSYDSERNPDTAKSATRVETYNRISQAELQCIADRMFIKHACHAFGASVDEKCYSVGSIRVSNDEDLVLISGGASYGGSEYGWSSDHWSDRVMLPPVAATEEELVKQFIKKEEALLIAEEKEAEMLRQARERELKKKEERQKAQQKKRDHKRRN